MTSRHWTRSRAHAISYARHMRPDHGPMVIMQTTGGCYSVDSLNEVGEMIRLGYVRLVEVVA